MSLLGSRADRHLPEVLDWSHDIPLLTEATTKWRSYILSIAAVC